MSDSFDERTAVARTELSAQLTAAGLIPEPYGRGLQVLEPGFKNGVWIQFTWNHSGYNRDDVIIKIGENYRHNRPHRYTDRKGKGYDWQAILTEVRSRLRGLRTFEESERAENKWQDESQALINEIVADHRLVPDEKHTHYRGEHSAYAKNAGLELNTVRYGAFTPKGQENVERIYALTLKLNSVPREKLDRVLKLIAPLLVEHELATEEVKP